MSTIQPHQQRVIDEKSELDVKLSKLRAFRAKGSGIYDSLTTYEKQRLGEQEYHMAAYSQVLGRRIAAFSPRPAMPAAQVETKTYADGTTATGPAPLPATSPSTVDPIEAEIVAKGLTAPRVTPADIEAAIASEHYYTAADGLSGAHIEYAGGTCSVRLHDCPGPLKQLTFCTLVLRNGFTVTGESAVASPENFDAEIGRKIARQKAIEKVWPLLGYQLREQLYQANQTAHSPA